MFARTALTGLLVAALIAIFPALAGASLAPTLTLNQGAGTQAGSSPATGFAINFNPKIADSVANLTMSFPPGFLFNLGANGGSCVSNSAPSPLCQLGSGTVNGPTGTPLALYLVAPPSLAYVAGVDLVIPGRATVTGGLSLAAAPAPPALSLAFNGIAPGVTELEFTLTSPRLPSTCGAANIGLAATGWSLTSSSAAAPLVVTGCGALPFTPTVSATVTKEPPSSNTGANVVVTLAIPPGDSAPSGIEFGTPTGVKINKILSPCFKGVTFTVGTVSAESPLLPSNALSTGLLTLSGAINSGSLTMPVTGSLTMSFPPPYQLSVLGPLNLPERNLTFVSLPDIPLSMITYTFTGTPEGPAFTTACEAGTIAASLVPQDGNPAVKVTGPVTNVGCPPPGIKPTATGTLAGLASGKPKLTLRASRGPAGPELASLRISLPSGLTFEHKLPTQQSCTGSGHQRRCTTKVHGLSLSGVAMKSARLQGGALTITFSHHVSKVTLTAQAGLLVESSGLERKAKEHKAGTPLVHLRITDATGTATTLSGP